MNEIAAAGNIAKMIETLGIIGILALISIIFIYLHIKEVRLMQEMLKDLNIKIKDLIESQKELNKRLFTLLLDRDFRNKE